MNALRHAMVASVVSSVLVVGVIAAPAGAGKGEKRRVEVAAVGTYAVGRVQETFVDDSRPTMATGTFAGAPNRTLLTTIFYPARGTYVEDEIVDGASPAKGDRPYPLVLFSHGLTANATVYEGVIGEWVSAGYVVAAPDYPLSNTDAPGGNAFNSGLADLKNQPADASFVIDRVLALAKERGSLRGMVARKRIGASGHSGGGITTLGLAYAACCTDDRVDATIPMSAVMGLVDDRANYFVGVDTPLLLMHGDVDGIVPYTNGTDAYAQASAPKYLLTFPGAGHVQPFVGVEGPQGDALVEGSIAFWDAYLKGDRDALDGLRDAASDPSVASLQEAAG
ncbi:MAG: alpha/beta hydrolase family protein [Acidimicrobiia bacterium]